MALALVFGALAGLTALSTGTSDAVGDFFAITVVVLVFGTVLTGTVIPPVGALVGYGYERSLSRRSSCD